MSDLTYRAVIAAGRVALRALDVGVRAGGVEHVPEDGPALLVANHVSFPDFLFIGRALLDRRPFVRFMCRHDIWDVKGVGRAMTAMRHIPVDRTAPAAAYLTARRLLADGEAVCVFPEAGISAAYVVRALMPGAAALARETGAPLVPVTIWGSQRIWAQKRDAADVLPRPDLTRGRLVDVRFGEPATVGDADPVAWTREHGHRMQRELEALQALPEHRPRPGELAPWYPAHLGGHALDRAASFTLDGSPRSAVAPEWGPLG
ncbi:lysophospholipid acyltransferase family protein [Nocardioides sp.]|uniref:lysophospholipid acyltransferase family protein n=1 Tax=Nocardioides sp. TaxID=35761 RepID=UPI002D7EA7F0|nr:lysophospholipid acyltransferase family protein [Nocardioides sp.]HET8959189.1 lysophospholipid acyltransferase family protein [Nocardioides sp.]